LEDVLDVLALVGNVFRALLVAESICMMLVSMKSLCVDMKSWLTNNEVPQNTKSKLLVPSSADLELQLRLDVLHLESRINDVEHRLAQLVLGAMLLAILLAVTGELQTGSLEDIVEATTPERAPVSVDGVVGGLADEAERREVLV
jgi:hypothetical protein